MERRKTLWWIIIGLLLFAITGLGSGIATFDSSQLGLSIFGVIDWLTASILYFFFGALIGLGIDFWISKAKHRNFKTPEWFYFTLAFIVLSSITYVISYPTSIVKAISFPFIYAIFFPSYTFYLFFPNLLEKNVFTKLILDIIYLGVLGIWIKIESKKSLASKILLDIIFMIQLIGMIYRVSDLS